MDNVFDLLLANFLSLRISLRALWLGGLLFFSNLSKPHNKAKTINRRATEHAKIFAEKGIVDISIKSGTTSDFWLLKNEDCTLLKILLC